VTDPGAGQPTIIFAGGGTGGHLFPALAIRERLLERTLDLRTLFLCSPRPIDAEILSRHGVDFRSIPARPFGLRPRALARFLASWGPSLRQARQHLRALTDAGSPVVLVAMGGFAAAPAVQAARVEKVPVILVNLDAVPGKANRWIARHAAKRLSAAQSPEVPGGWTTIPPIVRSASRPGAPPPQCKAALGLDPGLPLLLVTGGSQGARSVNELMDRICSSHAEWLAGWQVLHQTGADPSLDLARAYEQAGIPARVVPFIHTMGDAWGAADLAIARAGAGNVAEAWASGVPTVFMPYPYHRDQHQRKNAAPLVEAGAARVVTDRIDPGATLAESGRRLAGLLTSAGERARLAGAMARLGPADGAERAAAAILESLGESSNAQSA